MKSILFIVIAAVVGTINCGDETEDAALLSAGNTQFTAKMLSEVAKKNPSKSFVLSAFSVVSPLAQLALAAEGKSHDELLTAIGLPNDQSIKSVFSYLKSKLQSVKGVDFKMASKIYLADRYALNDEFALVSKNIFRSEVKNVNFTRSKQTAEEINNWVEDETNHRIKGLISPNSLKPDTRLLLVNAVYFKGTWKHHFEKSLTHPRDFHLSRDKTVKVPTMYRKGNYYYGENEALDATVLVLPYVGDESAFYIILPNKLDGISALQNKLKDSSALENALQRLYDVEVEVYVPKFKIETTTNLKDTLVNIGVESVFNTEANLTKVIKNGHDLYVSEAVQKAFIEIYEEGAEAAAANKFDLAGVSPVIHQTKTFVADHPFVYLLTIGRNIVFSGAFYQ